MEKEIEQPVAKVTDLSALDTIEQTDNERSQMDVIDLQPRARKPRRYSLYDENKREVPVEIIQTPLNLPAFDSIKMDVNAWIKEFNEVRTLSAKIG